MSYRPSRARAPRRTAAASTLTPRLMLPDCMMVARAAAALSFAISSADRPVVPMTCTIPASAASAAAATAATGTGKSRRPARLREQRLEVGRYLDAVRRQASKHAGVLADQRRARLLDTANKDRAGRVGDHLDQGAPHAPAGAQDHEPHVRHDGSP